ncbi:MAG: heat-inducible transcriptional repressor HrcA [Gammaproteobacteria bacterium]
MAEAVINERAQILLKSLVEYYIREGQPVGSNTLARESKLDISSATIRNVIAELERLGLVHSPHTSAGRIPTAKGYRLFIDNLLTIKPLPETEVRNVKECISKESDTKGVLEAASSILSGITRLAGVVTLPTRQQSVLRQIEFVRISDDRVLAILVFSDRDIQNRMIYTSRPYASEELQRLANCLNTEFLGKDIKEVRAAIVKEMEETKANMDRIMLHAIEMANKVFQQEDAGSPDFVMAGEINLMSYEEMADVNRLRQLFEAFNEKRSILQLLDHSLKAPGVQIFIGKESGFDALDDCSLVTATYSANNQVIGALGVIGPTRMAYDRVIPIVDVTAKVLGTVLNRRN